MKAYSNHLRLEIVSVCERGRRSQTETAELFGVSPATVGRTTMRRALLRLPRKKVAPRVRVGHAARFSQHNRS
jgi:transposase-like protein